MNTNQEVGSSSLSKGTIDTWSTKAMLADALNTLIDVIKYTEDNEEAHRMALKAYRNGRTLLFESLPEL